MITHLTLHVSSGTKIVGITVDGFPMTQQDLMRYLDAGGKGEILVTLDAEYCASRDLVVSLETIGI